MGSSTMPEELRHGFWGFQAFRLDDRQCELLCQQLHRRRFRLTAPAGRAVWLGHHACNRVGSRQLAQCRQGKFGRAHENNKGIGHALHFSIDKLFAIRLDGSSYSQ